MKIKKYDDVRVPVWGMVDQVKTQKTPKLEILKTLTFNGTTEWTDPTLPKELMRYGVEPPLGIRDVHELGITGAGVNVAIIDQPLALNHPEYERKIIEYREFCPDGYQLEASSMHGPAVTSLLAGENIGVAPDVRVFYAAAPSWLGDAIYEVEALKWIMEVNKGLPEKDKIKFVSVSAAPGSDSVRDKNFELWMEKVKEAQASGICVVECTEGNRFVTVGYVDYETQEFKYGFPHLPMKKKQDGEVHVPNSLRTVAESYDDKNFSYTYCGTAGLSWGIPYAVGVLCLGQQVNKDLSAMELKQILIETAQENNSVINPKEFLKRVKECSHVENYDCE